MVNVLERKDRWGGDTSRQIEEGTCTDRQERRCVHMDRRGDIDIWKEETCNTQPGDMYMQTDRRQVYTDRQETCTDRRQVYTD